jgi:hypothetical protein
MVPPILVGRTPILAFKSDCHGRDLPERVRYPMIDENARHCHPISV